MTVKTTKNVLVFGIIVTAVFLGTTFVMASPSAAVAPPSEGIARAAFSDDIECIDPLTFAEIECINEINDTGVVVIERPPVINQLPVINRPGVGRPGVGRPGFW